MGLIDEGAVQDITAMSAMAVSVDPATDSIAEGGVFKVWMVLLLSPALCLARVVT